MKAFSLTGKRIFHLLTRCKSRNDRCAHAPLEARSYCKESQHVHDAPMQVTSYASSPFVLVQYGTSFIALQRVLISFTDQEKGMTTWTSQIAIAAGAQVFALSVRSLPFAILSTWSSLSCECARQCQTFHNGPSRYNSVN